MRRAGSGLVSLSFCFFFVLLTGCSEKQPQIDFIDPPIGNLGEILSIHGENFGPEQNEFSYITIAGAPPTGSSYIAWKDDLITVRIPEFSSAGLIYVHRGSKRSNPALFTNKANMPEPVRRDEEGSIPRISSIEPSSGAIGSLITIYGSNFGPSRESAGIEQNGSGNHAPGVWFSWDAEIPSGAPAEAVQQNSVEVFDTDFGYEFWGEREIRVRIPDGAVSGNLEVRTSRNSSRPIFMEVTGKPGTKTFKDKRSYTLSYTVDIKAEEAELPNSLYLWIPKPISSASQRNTTLLSRSMEPYVDNYRGISLYQLTDLARGEGKHITLSYVTDVYTVESNVRYQNIKQEMDSPIQSAYTLSSSLIPADNEKITAQAAAIVGRERNPYLKAKSIYEWIRKEVDFKTSVSSGGALEALEEKQADSYSASLLFCSLARAAEVPAIPVAGVLIDRNRAASQHYWAEFWIDAFGWLPLDPALGAGAAPPDFNLREDYGAFYFGSMDNSRIAFSRGQINLSQMDPRGRITARQRNITFQNLWEEATGGLESYSSLWSDITIMGMYVQ